VERQEARWTNVRNNLILGKAATSLGIRGIEQVTNHVVTSVTSVTLAVTGRFVAPDEIETELYDASVSAKQPQRKWTDVKKALLGSNKLLPLGDGDLDQELVEPDGERHLESE
jgi:hypothetical protein